MAFCSLPCWTYFSALARTFCLLKPNNAIERELSRPGLSNNDFDTGKKPWCKPHGAFGGTCPGTMPGGHPQHRQMVHRTRPIVRLEVMNRMVTKGYRKGVYRRVTSGTRGPAQLEGHTLHRRSLAPGW